MVLKRLKVTSWGWLRELDFRGLWGKVPVDQAWWVQRVPKLLHLHFMPRFWIKNWWQYTDLCLRTSSFFQFLQIIRWLLLSQMCPRPAIVFAKKITFQLQIISLYIMSQINVVLEWILLCLIVKVYSLDHFSIICQLLFLHDRHCFPFIFLASLYEILVLSNFELI